PALFLCRSLLQSTRSPSSEPLASLRSPRLAQPGLSQQSLRRISTRQFHSADSTFPSPAPAHGSLRLVAVPRCAESRCSAAFRPTRNAKRWPPLEIATRPNTHRRILVAPTRNFVPRSPTLAPLRRASPRFLPSAFPSACGLPATPLRNQKSMPP